MAGYNRTRTVEQLLEKTESSPPSFTVHLHSEYWILNNGSKFLYHNQIASLLDDIRAHRIPVDFLELFDSARVPFYEGCMIVELLDYRPQKSQEPALKTPHKTRVVLHPNSETLWGDLCSLNQRNGGKWSDANALEIEAKLILATSPPLCLDPDPHLSRIVNHVLRVSTPSMPLSLKRKAATMEPEEDGPEKAKRERILTFMSPRDNRSHAPTYRMLDAFLASKKAASEAVPMIMPGNQYMNVPAQPPPNAQSHLLPPPAPATPAPPVSQSHSPTDTTDKGLKMKQGNTPQMPTFNVAFVQANGSHMPVPPQPSTHQFVNQHPPPASAVPPIMQPQVYASVQAATEAAKRAVTPSQQHAQLPQHHQLQQYLHYQQQQQQQQSHHQQPQSQQQQQQQTQVPQQRPPSQPQHPLAQQHPQQPTAQQVQQAQQRFTQSPKPPPQSNAASPPRTQPTPQPYPGTPSQFQPPIPSAHFLQQPPSGSRVPPRPQLPNSAQQQPAGPSQPTHSNNPSPAQIQFLYSQQLQQSQQQLQQQQAHTLLLQQHQRLSNMSAANAIAQKNGGRATPQVQMQQNQGQPQQQPQSATASPSPVRGSPIVTHQQLAAAAARSSPMPVKAQLPQQGQGQQPQQVPQQQSLGSQSVMQPPRVTFTPQYNPTQLRPMVHGNPQQGHLMVANNGQGAVNGTPKMAAASPRMVGRPITPAIVGVGPDGKPQQQQGLLMQPQQPIRRQTPLQQVHQPQQQQQPQQALNAGSPQAQHPNLAQVQAHVQAQQVAQQHQQQQQAQGQQTQPQAQTPTQQPAHVPPPYSQMYPYPYQIPNAAHAYWRMPGMMNNGASGTPTQQQQQHIQQFLQQRLAQQQQQQQGVSGGQAMTVNGQQPQQGGSMTAQQQAQAVMLAAAQQRAIAMQQQQQQAGQQANGPIQPAQAAMMGKMHTQTQAQMQAQAQAMGKGKASTKKGATAKKGPQR
ncbi:hypothetical protein GALMADRAFT_146917 [Galerina marginata CBS 339.88]|uniref:Spt20-like SEP domain-containing protein n=1 Tax=Galerina marginata (strain CBS 339.88) TaxID=685588 RepID=A0A067S9Q3_GALM3|nr:hypothetical protein GALMADRAFT_146917 [Galerina marginata CBS 339.88]